MCNENTRRRREKGIDKIFEIIMTEKFPRLMSDTKPQVQEFQRIPRRINCQKKKKTSISRHIIFKLLKIKDKEKIPERKQRKEKKNTFRGTKIKVISNFSSQMIQARREWIKIFKALREKNSPT